MTLSPQRLEKAAEAAWDSLKDDTHSGISWSHHTMADQRERFTRITRAAISAYLGDTHVDVPREPTEKMIYVMHHQIDWCRDDQDTHVPEHPSQTDNGIGTTCKQDICDAYEAAISAELTERDAG